MAIWSSEIKELEKLYESIRGQLLDLEKELERLVKAEDENMILLYSRRCLEVIITNLCECELKRPRKTEPLKGIIDKLHKEDKVPSHILASMHGLNELSTYGAHPKDFDPEQVKPILNNLDIIIKWYLKYKDLQLTGKGEEVKSEIRNRIISPSEKSIIVLPFENMSPDPDQDYFSDGLTEEIITDLSHIHDLLVISRNSAMTFKGTRKKTKEIASEVNVRYVLEGSVRKAGNNLRIVAQLIDGVNDSHLWAEKYVGTLDDIFDIQEKVSNSITSELKLKLSNKEKDKVSERPIKDIHAFEYYLRAKQEIYRYTKNSMTKAIDFLEKALKEEGDNSYLYAELAHAHYQFWNIGIRIEEEDLAKANVYVGKAFEIDNDSPDGHFVSGLLESTGGDVKKSIPHFKKVLKSSPNHTNALGWMTLTYAYNGIIEPTNQQIKKLMQLDPFSTLIMVSTMFLSIYNGEFEQAENQSRQLGSDDYSLLFKARALVYNRKYDEAYAEYNKISEDARNSYVYKCTLLLLNACMKKLKEINQLIDNKMVLWAKMDYAYSYTFAETYAMINRKEDALDWLENSILRGFFNYHFIYLHDPFLENIRGEERFKKLMERVKYEWENFEV